MKLKFLYCNIQCEVNFCCFFSDNVVRHSRYYHVTVSQLSPVGGLYLGVPNDIPPDSLKTLVGIGCKSGDHGLPLIYPVPMSVGVRLYRRTWSDPYVVTSYVRGHTDCHDCYE